MNFYYEYIERILQVIDEDRSKNLDFLITQDIGKILMELTDRWCEGCEYKERCEDEDE